MVGIILVALNGNTHFPVRFGSVLESTLAGVCIPSGNVEV